MTKDCNTCTYWYYDRDTPPCDTCRVMWEEMGFPPAYIEKEGDGRTINEEHFEEEYDENEDEDE